MTNVIVVRKSDGKKITIEHTDRGDIIPAYNADGVMFDAWTSGFRIDGEDFFVQVPKSLCQESTDPQQLRMVEDIAHLDALGYEFVEVEIA